MKIRILLFSAILVVFSTEISAQNVATLNKIKTITEYKINNKKKEIDHFTKYNVDGLKTEEIEYFSDGFVKTKTVYEYDQQKKCIKATKYGLKGKVEKVTTYEYDTNGTRIRENIAIPDKRYQTDKVYEYSYY